MPATRYASSPVFAGASMAKSSGDHIPAGGFVHSRTFCMGKMTSALFTACAWVILLGVIVTAVVRASTEAKERRTERNLHIAKSYAAR
jgi:hypothetical protein